MSRISRIRSVVRVAELQEAQATADVAACRQQLAQAQQLLQSAKESAVPPQVAPGTTTAFLQHRTACASYAALVRDLTAHVLETEKSLLELIDAHLAARQQTRSYDSLLERLVAENSRKQDAAEQRLVDDLAASRHGRDL